ncbi:MAG: hypothetical protein JW708_10610 [Vallitaleaceae bacterium]|nr:hypothetical protein [Vallitaleaceae bacterium]
MSLYDGWILTFILVGIIIIFVSFLYGKVEQIQNREKEEQRKTSYHQQIEYEEVNQKIIELNEYGEFLKKELDMKHKELLFVYQMISDKEKELKKIVAASPCQILEEEIFDTKASSNEIHEPNELRLQVIKMNREGIKKSDIAKTLQIDQGQVDLIINLYH